MSADERLPAGLSVEREPAGLLYAERAEVWVTLPSGHEARVTAEGPRLSFGRLRPAQVNWSAMGAVSAEDAMAYAETILEAARIAPTLSGSVES